MNKSITLTGTILIFLGIILGAFAAHGLHEIIDDKSITIFEKGVRYQMYMGLGLFALGLNAEKIVFSLKLVHLTALLGVIVFSGCIYIYALTGVKIFGAIIPIGGTLMIISWFLLIIKIAKQKQQ